MRVTTDKERIETDTLNKQAIDDIKDELIKQIAVLNKLSATVKTNNKMFLKGINMFYDKKGGLLAGSTIALNVAGLAIETALETYNAWHDYNIRLEENNEMLRRYGVADITNYTDLQRNIFTGKINGKRRY